MFASSISKLVTFNVASLHIFFFPQTWIKLDCCKTSRALIDFTWINETNSFSKTGRSKNCQLPTKVYVINAPLTRQTAKIIRQATLQEACRSCASLGPRELLYRLVGIITKLSCLEKISMTPTAVYFDQFYISGMSTIILTLLVGVVNTNTNTNEFFSFVNSLPRHMTFIASLLLWPCVVNYARNIICISRLRIRTATITTYLDKYSPIWILSKI